MPNQQEIDAQVNAAIENVKRTFLEDIQDKPHRIQPKLGPVSNTVRLVDTQEKNRFVAEYEFRSFFAEIPTGTKKNPREAVTHTYLPLTVLRVGATPDQRAALGLTTIRRGWNPHSQNTLRTLVGYHGQLPFLGNADEFRAESQHRQAFMQASQVYSHAVIHAAMREMDLPYGAQHGMPDMKFEKQLKRALMRGLLARMNEVPQQRRAYQDFVLYTGRKPSTADLALFIIMRPTLDRLRNTPFVGGVAYQLMMNKIQSARKDSSFTEYLRWAAKLTPKRAQEIARKHLDPTGVLLPRHWRALANEHPNGAPRYLYRGVYGQETVGYREKAAIMYRLVRDFWPVKKWPRVRQYNDPDLRFGGTDELRKTAEALQEFGGHEWPDIVKAYLEAVEKYANNPRKQSPHEPFHNVDGRIRLLMALIENRNEIKMTGDMKRASLKRLFELAKDNDWVSREPPESLRHGRFVTDNFPKEGAILTRDGVSLVPLRTHVDLYEEGNRMAHCLFTAWTEHVKKGNLIPYRVLSGGTHVGTVTLWSERGRIRIHQVVGKYNGRIDGKAQEIARQIAAEVCTP